MPSMIYHEVARCDWDALAVRCMWRYQVGVDPAALGRAVQSALPPKEGANLYASWDDGYWYSWLKNRLDDIGALRGLGVREPPPVSTATLHIFFRCLEETDDMLYLLRRQKDEPLPRSLWYAVSPAFHTERLLEPIDRVAARVVKIRK